MAFWNPHFILFVSVLILFGCSRRLDYKTGEVKRGSFKVVVSAYGIVEPKRKVELRSKASGEVIDIGFDVGSKVEKGQIVLRLDPRIEEALLRQAEANLKATEAELRKVRVLYSQAKRELNRLEKLLTIGGVEMARLESQRDEVILRREELERAEANLIKAEQELKNARVRFEDTVIYSPISGVILERMVEKGDVISSSVSGISVGSLLMIIADMDSIVVKAMVDESEIKEIKEGQKVDISLESFPGEVFEGSVSKISPEVKTKANTTGFELEVEIKDRRKSWFKPGMSAELEIVVDEVNDAILVPLEAVREKGRDFGVWLLERGKPIWRKIEPGSSNWEVVEVKSGLKPGDVVVLGSITAEAKE